MTVSITWSTTNGGSAIEGNSVDHGDLTNNSSSTAQQIYIRHNGANEITDCGFYVQAASDSYGGDFTAAGDLSEILAWGNALVSADYGGFELNLDADSSYPSGSWPSVTTKSVTDTGRTIGVVCRTGVGDSTANKISLVTDMGCTASETIQTGSGPNVRFKCRFTVPQSEDTVGIRQIKVTLTYTYTS